MAEIKWIKLNTNIFDNEKIRIIERMPEGDALLIVWLKLLTLAGKKNDHGHVYLTETIPYTPEVLGDLFNKDSRIISLALNTFVSFGMISIEDDMIKVLGWEKHQNVEGMDRIREQNRKRVAKHRERKKLEACNVTVTLSNGIEEDKEEELEEDKSKSYKEKNIKKEKTTTRFSKPSLEEIEAYCLERNNTVIPQKFKDYYEANGWKVGRNPMKDWKAAVRTWEQNNKCSQKPDQYNMTGRRVEGF